jgi:hypothetical protein
MLGKSYDNLAKTSAKKQGENLDDFSLHWYEKTRNEKIWIIFHYIGIKKRMSGVFAYLLEKYIIFLLSFLLTVFVHSQKQFFFRKNNFQTKH